jgi:hypothetical protein
MMKRRHWESLLLPILLMVTGALVLAGADLGLVSLDRVKDLWPAAIILVGLVELLSDDSPVEREQQ